MSPIHTLPQTISAEVLVRRLAERLDATPLEATRALGELVRFIRTRVEHDGRATVAGLGQFRIENGALAFEPDDALAAAVNARYAGLAQMTFAGGTGPLAYRKHEVVRPSAHGDGHAPPQPDAAPGGRSVPAEPELSPLSEPPTLAITSSAAPPSAATSPAERAAPPSPEIAASPPPAPEPPTEAPPEPPAEAPSTAGTAPDATVAPPRAASTLDAEDAAFWKELDDLERLLRGPLTPQPPAPSPAMPASEAKPGTEPSDAASRAETPRAPRPLDAWLASPTELPPTTSGWTLLGADDLDADLNADLNADLATPDRSDAPSPLEPFADAPPSLEQAPPSAAADEPELPSVPGFDLMDLDDDDEVEAFAPSPFAPPSTPAAETYGFDELDEASWAEDDLGEQRVKPLEPEVESAWERDPTERMGPPPALTWPSAAPPEPSLRRSEPVRAEPDAYAPPSFETETLPLPASHSAAPAEPPSDEPTPTSEAVAAPVSAPPPSSLAPEPPATVPSAVPSHAAPPIPAHPYAPAAPAPAPATPPSAPPHDVDDETDASPSRLVVPQRPTPRRRDGSGGLMLGAILLIVAAAVALSFALGPTDDTDRASGAGRADATRSVQPASEARGPVAPRPSDDILTDRPALSEAEAAGEPEQAILAEHTRETPPDASRTTDPPARTLTPALRAALRSPDALTLPAAGAAPSFTLIVLSTTDEAEAQRVAERYSALGYRTGVVYGPYRDRVRYRVAVGTFATRADATRARDATRDELPSGAWVMPLRAALDLVAAR